MPSTIEQADPPSDPPKEADSPEEVDPPEAHYDLKDPAGLASFLIDSDIKLIRAEYLMTLLDANGLFPRRQEAETMTFIDSTGASRTALVSHEEMQAWADGSKEAIVCSVSHAWEAREHPDPCGHQLLQLVHHTALYVAAFLAEIWLFFDYTSLFQYLRETNAQQTSFGLAMKNMHVMYAHEMSLTFRIETLTLPERWAKALDEGEMLTVFDATNGVVKPVLIKDLVHNPTNYDHRGWCIGEVEWSSDREATAQNQVIDIRRDTTRRQELRGRVPTSPQHFAVKMDTAAFTHRSDAAAVIHLQEKIFLEKVKRNQRLSLEGLPTSQILALGRALPYFEVLESITLVDFECGPEEAEAFAQALRETKVVKFQCRANWQYEKSVNYMIQALAAALNETSIVDLNFSREDPFRDATMDVATVQVLADALETNDKVTHLKLELCEIKVEGIKALVAALKSNKTVVDINLGSNQWCGNAGAEELAEVLKTNSTITHLTLYQCHIGVKGVKALAAALRSNKTVVDINLAYNKCVDEGAEAIAVALGLNATIKCLNLEYCGICDTGVEALASALRINKSLTHLWLRGNRVGVQGAQALASALMVNRAVGADWNQDDTLGANLLCRNPFGASTRLQALADALRINQTITRLDLDNYQIGEEGMKALADALRIHQTVTELHLNNIPISDEGLKVLADALTINQTITDWHLPHNQIGDEGWKALADALRINQTICQLFLYRNQIGDEGLKALADALRINQTICHLFLFRNQIGDEGVKVLADALKINQTITELDLCDNQISDEGVKVLADALKINQTITELRLNNNQIGDEGVKALAAALEANKTVTIVSMLGNKLTDEGKQAVERIEAICKENKARRESEMQKSPVSPVP